MKMTVHILFQIVSHLVSGLMLDVKICMLSFIQVIVSFCTAR